MAVAGSAAAARLAPDDRVDALRRRIADVVAGDAPTTPALPTGVPGLDAALRGGLPRGRLTELLGAPGAGKTTLARRMVARTLADGGWVAWVDATCTLAPRDWAPPPAADPATAAGRLWVLRPPDGARAAWCADVLLRSGAFGLVVLDGGPVLPRAVALRLLQLARDADAALLVLGDGTRASDLGGALRLRVAAPGREPHDTPRTRWRVDDGRRRHVRQLVVTVEKGGSHRTVEVSCAIGVARRLCAHPEVPDRRDVARAAPGAPARDAGVAARPPAPPPAPVRRGRRCAEPALGRP